jgi:gliding motility-associated-like protein
MPLLLRILSFLLLKVLLLSPSTLSGQNINGPNVVCANECYTYILSSGMDGFVNWTTDAGSFDFSNNRRQINICFDKEVDSGIIEAFDQIAKVSSSISISIDKVPKPIIHTPSIPTCQDSLGRNGGSGQDDGPQCLSACPNFESIYSVTDLPDFTYEWEVIGGSVSFQDESFIHIDWQAGQEAGIQVKTISPNGCTDSSFICIEVLEERNTRIESNGQVVQSLTVCKGQEVNLNAISDGFNETWVVSDGRAFSGSSIDLSFNQAGSYSIDLYTVSECGCPDITPLEIIVSSQEAPKITCTGTTCTGKEATYFAVDDCSVYNWSVSGNGTITAGGGSSDDFISILWGSGPQGEVSLSVTGCSSSVCSETSTIIIPIIDPIIGIRGDDKVCPGAIEKYSVPFFEGTQYQWTVNQRGSIIAGYGTHQITVQWDNRPWEPEDGLLEVSYENCFLECNGSTQKTVEISEEPSIYLGGPLCLGQERNTGISVWQSTNWTVTAPSGTVFTYGPSPNFTHTYNEVGIYKIEGVLVNDDYCEPGAVALLEVVDQPQAPASINGPEAVCPGSTYTYSIDRIIADQVVSWEIIDGNNSTIRTSNSISYTWMSNGPFEIRVQVRRPNQNCWSDPFTKQLFDVTSLSIQEVGSACKGEVSTFTLEVDPLEQVNWQINPPDAGDMVQLSNNTIQVQWRNSGNHSILASYCASAFNHLVGVNETPTVTPIKTKVCEGDTYFTTITGDDVNVFDIQGNLVSNGNSVNLSEGHYIYEVTNNFGCSTRSTIEIASYPEPHIRASSPEPNGFCLPHPPVEIVAINTDEGYTYRWFKDGVPYAGNTPSISTNAYGSYEVEITDVNGCRNTSNPHRLFEFCGGGTCTADGTPVAAEIVIADAQIECNNFDFSLASTGHQSTQWTWYFDDPQSLNNTAMGTSVNHEFSRAGYYYVLIQGNVPREVNFAIIEVPLAPRFNVEDACIGEAAQFTDISTFIPSESIASYSWNFGDPMSANNNSNDQNPTHIYDQAGIYTVQLTVESSTGCIASYSKEVEVYQEENITLLIDDITCTNQSTVFDAIYPPNIVSAEWDFGDPASGVLNTSQTRRSIHTYANPGTYNVVLRTQNIYGCEHFYAYAIVVEGGNLSGTITADKANPICQDDRVTLTAPIGLNYQWSNGETTQSIFVENPGLYTATVTPNSGCPFVTDAYIVEKHEERDLRILANLNNDFLTQYENLVVCLDDQYTLFPSLFISGNLLWSEGQSSYSINNWELSSLGVGVHEISLDITETSTGCVIKSDPFRLEIIDYPNPFSVEGDQTVLCSGSVHELRISNPNPDYLYIWSNGQEGTSIQVASEGYYYAIAYNSNGCERFSNNGITVQGLPNAKAFMSGCVETCFPDVLCMPTFNNVNAYSLLYNGTPISSGNFVVPDFDITEPGDYQLILSNNAACQDTSDILSVSAMPTEQRIEGLVYLDVNGDCQYNAGDQLLENVSIDLLVNSQINTSVNSDVNGAFNFDPITASNIDIHIDEAATGYFLCQPISSNDLLFKNCRDTLLLSIGLTNLCPPITSTLDLFTCPGTSVDYEGVSLSIGEVQDFTLLNSNGCDSVVTVSVFANLSAPLSFTTEPSCYGQNNGTLILDPNPEVAGIIVDANLYQAGDIVEGLVPGSYSLDYVDVYGCQVSDLVFIDEFPQAQYSFFVNDICPGSNNGSIEVQSSGNNPILEIAVDQDQTFSNALSIGNLSIGTHILYLKDENNCVYQEAFEILESTAPIVTLQVSSTCPGMSSGTLSIDGGTAGLSYAVDNAQSFTDSLQIQFLGFGQHTLYLMDENGCIFEENFFVDTLASPSLELLAEETCPGEFNGSIEILNYQIQNQYTLNGSPSSIQGQFLNLGEGVYSVKVTDENTCTHEEIILIDTFITPSYFINSEASCSNENNGSLSISTMDGTGSQYMLNGQSSTTPFFENLAAGDYTIQIIDPNNCTIEIDASITEYPTSPIDLYTEAPCPSESNGRIQISNHNGSMSFNFNGTDLGQEPIIEDLPRGSHFLIVTDQNACTQSYAIELEEADQLDVVFEEVVLDCSIEEVVLQPTVLNSAGEVQYMWSSGASSPELRVSESGSYSVEVEDKCTIEDHVYEVTFTNNDPRINVGFANIFSPNGDQINDCFRAVPEQNLDILSYRFLIYDRWGNMVFESDNPEDCWDGRYKGSPAVQGVYVYLLEMSILDCETPKTFQRTGDITVVY